MNAGNRFCRSAAVALFLWSAVACRDGSHSRTTVVDVPHTPARAQAIGNCWNYATLGWAESLILQSGAGERDFSEAYVTLRHFEEQLLAGRSGGLEVAGSFSSARSLIATHGLVPESAFPSVVEGRSVEKAALDALNESLSHGPLARLPQNGVERKLVVRSELERAFRVSLDELEARAIPASRIVVKGQGGLTALSEEMYRWSYVDFPVNLEDLPRAGADFPYRARLSPEQRDLLARLKRALGARKPVLVAWFVDSHAMGDDGIFSAENWLRRGSPGDQGMHLSVAEDYTASGVDPVTGEVFRVGEGEVGERERTLAERHGSLDALILKNSWGSGGYRRDDTGGFSFLDATYLFAWLPRPTVASEPAGSELVLRSLVLPNEPTERIFRRVR